MDFKPGDVVILKSGGHALTVAEVSEHHVECIWLGDEGDLFRESLPIAVIELAEVDTDGDDEEEDDEDGEEDHAEADEHDDDEEHGDEHHKEKREVA